MSVGATIKGLPYPNGDDPVAQGDDRIKGLAEALDTSYLKVLDGTFTAATLGGPYPEGWSYLNLNSTNATAGGWPTASVNGSAIIITCKRTSSYVVQWCFRGYAVATLGWVRTINAASLGGWSSTAGPAMSAGTQVVNVTASATGTANVTFPVGRFAVPPVVTLCCENASIFLTSVSNVTAAGFTITLRYYISGNTTTSSPVVHWQATAAF